MTRVEVRNGNVDGALKRFKVVVTRDGIPSEIKKRKHYEKPGVKRRKAKDEAVKNAHKKHSHSRD